MKALPVALVLVAAAAQAQPLVLPPRPSPVVSPLTNSTSQSGQALLDQIQGTIRQRMFEHQVLTLQMAPAQSAPVIVTQPVIRPR
jgi:hypothetical protein